MNVWDILILIVVAVIVFFSGRAAFRHRKCGGDCSSCPEHGHCDQCNCCK